MCGDGVGVGGGGLGGGVGVAGLGGRGDLGCVASHLVVGDAVVVGRGAPGELDAGWAGGGCGEVAGWGWWGGVSATAGGVVAGGGAGVGERLAGLGDELPVVACGVQRQLEDAVGRGVAHLAVWRDRGDRGVVLAAGADDELADPAGRVGDPGGGLLGEALVDVVMAVQHDVCVGGIQRVPQRSCVLGGAPAGAKQRDVEAGKRARRTVRRQIRRKPAALRARWRAATRIATVGIQDHHMPARADIEAVVALPRLAGRRTPVREVPRRARVRRITAEASHESHHPRSGTRDFRPPDG